MRFCTIVLIIIAGLTQFIPAQSEDWKITGHLQMRTELDGRDFSNSTHPYTFASLRTRLGVEKSFGKLGFFVQAQDSRVFGEESSTLSNHKNLDLHQGYVVLSDIFDSPFTLQAGRFEMVYGTERFFGAVGWHYVGRAWDGARLRIKSKFNLDLFALTQSETQAYIANAVAGIYPKPAVSVPGSSIYGFWSSFFINEMNQIDPFFYYDVNRFKPNGEDLSVSRYTAGLNYFFRHRNLDLTFEGAYQFGKLYKTDISAYLLSIQLMHSHKDWKLGAGADVLSGNSADDDKVRTFTPAYGTNHKFYGYMDYFINIPVNTNSLGLHDFYLTAGFNPQESKFGGNIFVHHFASNQKLQDETTFGQEIDLTVSYKFVKGTSLTWGGSVFLPGEIMKTFYRTIDGERKDPAFWTYLMISAAIQ